MINKEDFEKLSDKIYNDIQTENVKTFKDRYKSFSSDGKTINEVEKMAFVLTETENFAVEYVNRLLKAALFSD